jgi:hypothetical protein
MSPPSFVTESELATELLNRPGLIPVSIDSSRLEITWLDLDGYHCYEGFFHQSLASYTALCKVPPPSFRTSLDVLASVGIQQGIYPTGFIFHAGRCGSTLLAKVLARSRANLVLSEAAPHNQIWRALPRQNPAAIAIYRNLILAMGRRRLESYRAHVIKFTSFNIAQFGHIRAAFPGVPALFLFREPAAVLESYRRRTPGWIGRDLGVAASWDEPDAAIEAFFRVAASMADPDFRCLDYASLNTGFLPSILRFLRMEPSHGDLRAMTSEFGWDAKSGRTPRPFDGVRSTPHSAAPAALAALYRQLNQRAAADWERDRSAAAYLRGKPSLQ